MSDFISRIAAKRKLAAGELVLCMGLRQARTADIAMIAAACDFDAIYVDMEYSPISLDLTSTICCAALGAGILPIVRVPGHDVHMATRALDGGALGIIFPHVESAAQAEHMPPARSTAKRSALGACAAISNCRLSWCGSAATSSSPAAT